MTTTTTVREASAEEDLSTNSRGNISVEIDTKESVDPLYEYYPSSLETQKIVRGSYSYSSSPKFGSSEQSSGEFQFRTGSGMFILMTHGDHPKPKKIISELESAEPNIDIKSRFIPDRQKIWDFIDASDKIGKVVFVEDDGFKESTSKEEIDIEEARENPVDLAKLQFEYQNEDVIITYKEDKLSVNAEKVDSPVIEYVIQVFESTVLV